MQFRDELGLRSDEAWVLHVFSDPESEPGKAAFGTPLLPVEVAELERRARNAEAVFPVLVSYGLSHPSQWAGVFIDQKNNGRVVALFVDNQLEHMLAIKRLLHPEAQFAVLPARWSLTELQGFKDQVESQRDWFSDMGSPLWRSQVVVPRNVLEVRVSSTDPDVADTVMSHFGSTGWLSVISDGIGPWVGARGSLLVRAIDDAGQPFAGTDFICLPIPSAPAAYTDGPAWGTNGLGQCHIPDVGATTYEVQLLVRNGEELVMVGSSSVTVLPDRETTVVVIVDAALMPPQS